MEEKVAAMPDSNRSVLQAAAIVGASFDPSEVIHLSGLGTAAESVIESLMERGVFREDAIAGGSRLTFASTLLLDAINALGIGPAGLGRVQTRDGGRTRQAHDSPGR